MNITEEIKKISNKENNLQKQLRDLSKQKQELKQQFLMALLKNIEFTKATKTRYVAVVKPDLFRKFKNLEHATNRIPQKYWICLQTPCIVQLSANKEKDLQPILKNLKVNNT